MAHLMDDEFVPEGTTWLYRTKDFRGIPHPDGYEVIGTHRAAIDWLKAHKADNLRGQFVVNDRLVASDETELQAILDAVQKERVI